MRNADLQKAIAPFSLVLITGLIGGNIYFAKSILDRIEKKLDLFEARINRNERVLDVLQSTQKRMEIKCLKKFLKD